MADAVWPIDFTAAPPVALELVVQIAAALGAAASLAVVSAFFGPTLSVTQARVVLGIWSIGSGAVYVWCAWPARFAKGRRPSFLTILVTGLLMRLIVLPTPAFLEVDYHRYLWDGAVTAHGINPYRHSPTQVQLIRPDQSNPQYATLALLADQGSKHLSQINFPQLTTIYGPVAQAAFAVAHWIKPWSIVSWRAVLLLFDLMTALFLILLLRAIGLSDRWVMLYWWNPLVLCESVSSGHMDLTAVAFVVASLLMAVRRRPIWAVIALAIAAGSKIWPVLLLPLVIRWASPSRRQRVIALVVFMAASVLIWLPVLAGPLSQRNGFLAYGKSWENNSGVFQAMFLAMRRILMAFRWNPYIAEWGTRVLTGTVLLCWVGWQSSRSLADGRALVHRSLLVVAGAFLLSPTQFPWYYLWILPLLAAIPYASLLSYSALLGLYYVHYDHPWIVWFEHLPIIAFLMWELAAAKLDRVRPVEGRVEVIDARL